MRLVLVLSVCKYGLTVVASYSTEGTTEDEDTWAASSVVSMSRLANSIRPLSRRDLDKLSSFSHQQPILPKPLPHVYRKV